METLAGIVFALETVTVLHRGCCDKAVLPRSLQRWKLLAAAPATVWGLGTITVTWAHKFEPIAHPLHLAHGCC